MYNPIKLFFAVVLLVLVAAAPATQPAFSQDALDLGSADPAVRVAATQRLWMAGDAALPVLREAAKSANPEAAGRARQLIRSIDRGFTPYTPSVVGQLLDRYESAPRNADRSDLLQQLAQNYFGLRALLSLRDRSTDPRERAAVDALLARWPRVVVALRLAQGRQADAEAFLADCAGRSLAGASDYVVYWQSRGKVRDRMADLGTPNSAGKWRIMALLRQAAGDPAGANRAAAASKDPALVQRLLIQQANWPALEKQLPADDKAGTLPEVALRAFVARCAGDSAAADRIIHLITTNQLSKNPPPEPGREAFNLCMLDRPADAERILCDTGNLEDAFDLMQARQEYGPALALWKRGKPGDAVTARLQARAAAFAWLLGHADAASRLLSAGIATNLRAHDGNAAALLSHAADQQGKVELANSLLLESLSHGEESDYLAIVTAGIPNPDPNCSLSWWRYLKTRESPPTALKDLRRIAAGQMPLTELRPLADGCEQWAHTQSDPGWVLRAISATYANAHQPGLALAVAQRQADATPADYLLVAVGDLQGQLHDWPAAAEAYGLASAIESESALAVMQQGWATLQAGDATGARALFERADILPLGDVYTRQTLIQFAEEHGMTTDADRERATLLAAGDVGDYGAISFLEPLADAAEAKGQYALSAQYWEQVFTTVIRLQLTFSDPSANAAIPARMHRLRAQGYFAQHRIDAAMAEARLSWNDDPADVDCIVALIRSADAAGAASQAKELYRAAVATYARNCTDNPGCLDMQNGLAWLEARCHGDLDDALAHAERAAALAPDNAAVLDTLAEAHYQRHEFQTAIDISKHCVKLDPDVPMFRDRLAHFQLALKTGVADND